MALWDLQEMSSLGFAVAGAYVAVFALALVWTAITSLLASLAARRRDRQPPEEAPVDEPSTVITLVHGTWSRRAAWTQPGSPLRRTGRVAESLPHYTAAMTAAPLASQAGFGYAIGLVRLRRWAEARDHLAEGAKSFPDQPGFDHALARVLAAAPDDRVRDGGRALAIMQALTRDQQTVSTSETMAMALAELGRFDEAVRWQRTAIGMASQSGRIDVVRRLAANLGLYETRRPCRVPWADDDPIHHPAAGQ